MYVSSFIKNKLSNKGYSTILKVFLLKMLILEHFLSIHLPCSQSTKFIKNAFIHSMPSITGPQYLFIEQHMKKFIWKRSRCVVLRLIKENVALYLI